MSFKRLTAFISAAALLGTIITVPAATVAVGAEDSELITLYEPNNTATWDQIKVYDEAVGETAISNYYSSISVAMGNDWNSNNGIRLDVTDMLADCKSGGSFEVSFDLKCWAWGSESYLNKATVFFETESGVKTTLFTGPSAYSDVVSNTATVSGSGTYEFNTDEKIYLCVTHGAGTQQYSNFIFKGTPAGDAPVQTEEPEDTLEVLYQPNNTDTWNQVQIYDETVGTTGITNYYSFIEASLGNDWNSNNGIKIDVTDMLSGCRSGGSFEVSFDLKCWAWGSESWLNKAIVFFETESGVKTTLFTGPSAYSDVVSNTATVSGSGTYEFNTDEKIYLCVTHGAGTQQYSNFVFKGEKAEAAPTPTATAEVTEAPTPTATVEVTEAPTPTATVEVTEAPTPTATVEVTEAPTPTATVEVTEAPTPTATVEVTEAPTPTATVEVTEAPTPTATVEVTEAPTPTATVEVTEAPTPTATVEVTEAPTPTATAETVTMTKSEDGTKLVIVSSENFDTAVLIRAVYNESGALEGLSFVEDVTALEKGSPTEVDLDSTAPDKGSVKYLLLDSVDKLKSLSRAFIVD